MAQSVTQFSRNSAVLGCIFVRAKEQIRQNARWLREGTVAILRCFHDPVVITLQALLGLFELRLAPDRRR